MDELKSRLKELLINTSINEDCQRKINYMHRDTIGFHGIDKIAGMVALFFGIAAGWEFFNVPSNTKLGKFLLNLPALLSFIYMIVALALVLATGALFCGITIYAIAFARKKANDAITQRRLENNKEKLESLKEEYYETKDFIAKDNTLPYKYRYFHAVNHIYGYLDTLRADSLKEAINLYEIELRNDRDSAKLEEIARLSQRAVEAAEDAAASAAKAEFNSRYY